MWVKYLLVFALAASCLSFEGNLQQLGIRTEGAVVKKENLRRYPKWLPPGVCGIHSIRRCIKKGKYNGRQVHILQNAFTTKVNS